MKINVPQSKLKSKSSVENIVNNEQVNELSTQLNKVSDALLEKET